MLTRRPFVLLAFLVIASGASLVGDVKAETILKFDLAGTPGPDIGFQDDSFGLIPDGNSGSGDKSTDLKFFGFLSSLDNIPADASMSISGIQTDGSATVQGNSVFQVTTGGSFSVWDDSSPDVLLLAGDIGAGLIAGSDSESTGSFFSTNPILYTGGSLLPLLQPSSGGITLSLSEITSAGGSSGLNVVDMQLQDFSASATGQLEATAVPEPSVLGMAAIGALVVFRQHRRRKAKTA